MRKLKWVVIGFLALVVAVLAGLYLLGRVGLHQSVSASDDSAFGWQDNWVMVGDDLYAFEEDAINILVLGIDRADELSGDSDFVNYESGQADAIFVVHLSPSEEKISILAIPRNSMVDIDIYDDKDQLRGTVFDQICLQYPYAGGGNYGCAKMKESVSRLLYGLPINGVVAISYGVVNDLVDKVGGVDVVALESLDTWYGSFEEGEELHLSGEMVWAYLKERNKMVMGSPTMRLERQKQFLAALGKKMIDEVKCNPTIVNFLYLTAKPYMVTDISMGEVMYLATELASYTLDDVDVCSLQGEDVKEPVVVDGMETANYYDNYYLDEDNINETMIKMFLTAVE